MASRIQVRRRTSFASVRRTAPSPPKMSLIPILVMGPTVTEHCAANMAAVHIKEDLRDALGKVKDVNVQDYGNVLYNCIPRESLRRITTARTGTGGSRVLAWATRRHPFEHECEAVAERCLPEGVRQGSSDPSPDFAAAYRQVLVKQRFSSDSLSLDWSEWWATRKLEKTGWVRGIPGVKTQTGAPPIGGWVRKGNGKNNRRSFDSAALRSGKQALRQEESRASPQ